MPLLVKRSRKNQVALPKTVLERAGLGPDDVYFLVGYERGAIVLRPVDVEEKISPESIARFEAKALQRESGDRTYRSTDDLIAGLHRKRHSRRK